MDAETWIGYKFHMSQNVILLIVFQPFKHVKLFLAHRPEENRLWAGFVLPQPPAIILPTFTLLYIGYKSTHILPIKKNTQRIKTKCE